MQIVFKYKAELPFRGCLAFLLEIHLGIKNPRLNMRVR